MVVVNVLDELIHVAHVPGPAAFPRADSDLFLKVIFILAGVYGGAWDVAVGIGRYVGHAFERVRVCLRIRRDSRGSVRPGGGNLESLGRRSVVQYLGDLVGELILGGRH